MHQQRLRTPLVLAKTTRFSSPCSIGETPKATGTKIFISGFILAPIRIHLLFQGLESMVSHVVFLIHCAAVLVQSFLHWNQYILIVLYKSFLKLFVSFNLRLKQYAPILYSPAMQSGWVRKLSWKYWHGLWPLETVSSLWVLKPETASSHMRLEVSKS